MAPLTDLVSEDGFERCPVHEEALTQLTRLANEILVLRPISYTLGEPIYLCTDASKVGAGAWVGQGPTPETAIPVSFRSQKFATT
jgi:hypothetical protein